MASLASSDIGGVWYHFYRCWGGVDTTFTDAAVMILQLTAIVALLSGFLNQTQTLISVSHPTVKSIPWLLLHREQGRNTSSLCSLFHCSSRFHVAQLLQVTELSLHVATWSYPQAMVLHRLTPKGKQVTSMTTGSSAPPVPLLQTSWLPGHKVLVIVTASHIAPSDISGSLLPPSDTCP